MNTAASMGPVQFAGLTYLICAVISLSVAGMIQLLVGIINLRKSRAAAKTAAADSHEKTISTSRSKG
jgi:hypothetical protein